MIALGDPIPLIVQLRDGATDKHIRATVRNALGTEILGSPFTLAHESEGYYRNVAGLMPSSSHVVARYKVYDDAGFTTPSEGYDLEAETFYLSQGAGGGDGDPLLAQPIVGIVAQTTIIGLVKECS